MVYACSTVNKFHLSVNDGNLNADKYISWWGLGASGISNFLLNLDIK